jgi:methyl-accepting chemotaxis protein
MTTLDIKLTQRHDVSALVQNYRLQFASVNSKYVGWSSAVVALVLVVTWLFFRLYTQVLVIAGIILIITAGAKTFPFLQRRGQSKEGIYLMLGSLLLVVGSIPLLVPALLPGVAVGYVTIIILANLLLGGKGSRWVTAACVFGFSANFVLTKVWDPGWFQPLQEMPEWVISGLACVAVLVADVFIVQQIVGGMEQSFAQAQQARLEVEDRATAEKEERERLQATVKNYVDYLTVVARGNLAERLPLVTSDGRDDPLILLGNELNNTVASLQRISLQVQDMAGYLASASAEILAATAQQAAGVNEQSIATTQASATIDQVRAISEQTVQRAQAVANLAQRMAEVSLAGQQAVANTIHGMGEVKAKVGSIATNILSLSEQAQAIGSIIATVNEIADQSHMLALNAAVEASRAGAAGAGFAVVAQEVRSLARKSQAATVQVDEILSEIQRGVNTSVMATEDGLKGVEAGMKLAGEAGLAIQKLAENVGASTQAAAQIAAAAGQQLSGMEQISQAVASIDQATVQSVGGAQQVEQAAVALDDLAGQLRVLVEQYRL